MAADRSGRRAEGDALGVAVRTGGRFTAALALTVALVPVAHAGSKPSTQLTFPAAGPIVVPTTIARAQPSAHARRLLVIHQFRDDYRDQWVFAVAARKGDDGRLWVQLRLQLRPNGTLGWIPASAVALTPVHNKIIVHRGLRVIDVYDHGRLVVRAPVAIIRGEWDAYCTDADARWLFDALAESPNKRDIKISRGTHLMHLEAMRYALYRESIAFLAGGDEALAGTS